MNKIVSLLLAFITALSGLFGYTFISNDDLQTYKDNEVATGISV